MIIKGAQKSSYKYLQLSTARKFQVTINAAEWVFHCGADIYVSSIKQGTQILSHIYAKKIGLDSGGLDLWKKVRFQQTHNQGLRQLFLTVSWEQWT